MRRGLVKVIATLGPSTSDSSTIRSMMMTGVHGFRINMSHGDEEQWSKLLGALMEAESGIDKRPAIIGDLEGPRIRLGAFEPVRVKPGDIVALSMTGEGIPVNHREFFDTIEEGDTLLIADGRVILRVEYVEGLKARARVVEGDVVEPGKGVVVKGKEYNLPPLTERDKRALEFIRDKPFTYVMASYVRGREDVEVLADVMRKMGREDVKILAKIETPSGVRRASEIARASDGIVIARGDLGMHYSLEEVPMIQEGLVDVARREYKPVILATEILASMMNSPTPTRSEVADAFNAVAQGVDGVLLTGETAIGRYPLKSVRWINKILSKAERIAAGWEVPAPREHIYRLARGLVELAQSLGATIIVYSRTGKIAERIAAFRPSKPFYVGVPNEAIERRVRLYWGAEPVIVGDHGYEEGLERVSSLLEREGVIGLGDIVVEAAWSSEKGIYVVRVRNIIV